ncbi:hypothetical protein AB4Y72_16485 [Arthrobacter sp. YAF34]
MSKTGAGAVAWTGSKVWVHALLGTDEAIIASFSVPDSLDGLL